MFDDRAVADTVAFVLTFAIIITSVGIVSTVGFDTLTDLRDDETVHNAERGMVGLARDFDTLHEGRAPQRTAQLALNGGQVYLNDSTFSVAVRDSSGSKLSTTNVSVMSLEHEVRGSEIVYENGAVIRSDSGTLAHDPPIYCRPSGASLSLVNVENETYDIVHSGGTDQVERIGIRTLPTNGTVALESSGRIALTGTRNGSSLNYSEPMASNTRTVVVNVTDTSNPDDWRRYFRHSDWSNTTADPNTYECDATTIHIHVTRVELKVD